MPLITEKIQILKFQTVKSNFFAYSMRIKYIRMTLELFIRTFIIRTFKE